MSSFSYSGGGSGGRGRGRGRGRGSHEMPKMQWQPWQVEETAVELPSTEGGSNHSGVKFECFRCGTLLLSSDQIFKFNRGAIWTNCFPSTLAKESDSPIYNQWKKCNMYSVRCKNCRLNIGQLYPDRYEPDLEDKDDKPFPCVKFTYIWKSNKLNKLFNSSVIRSDKADSNPVNEEDEVRAALEDMDISDLTEMFSSRLKTCEYDDMMKRRVDAAGTSSSSSGSDV